MITIYESAKGTNPKEIYQLNDRPINDIRDTLKPNQFLIAAGRDAKKCLKTLGSANVKMEAVYWNAPRFKSGNIYCDHIFTVL